jgi:hypothetical protein
MGKSKKLTKTVKTETNPDSVPSKPLSTDRNERKTLGNMQSATSKSKVPKKPETNINSVDHRKDSDLNIVANMASSSENNEKIMARLQSDTEALTLAQKVDEMWAILKKIIKSNPAFMDLPDKEKLKYFREDLNYKDLMTDHPIVTRYLICMGQYSTKAFRRFLYKVKNTPVPPANLRKKGEMEDMWIRRQADYVRYLWESYQKKHYSPTEAAVIWQDTYTKLKGEFDDFRNTHKKAEEKVKEDKVTNNALNLKELLNRIKTGVQKIEPEEEKQLIAALKHQLYARRYKNALDELLKKVKLIEHSCEGVGKGLVDPDVKTKEDQDKPKITMIETVDAEKYDQYDSKYKQPTSRDKVIEEIRGMESVQEDNNMECIDENDEIIEEIIT